MLQFKTQFDDHARVYQSPGSRLKPHYQSRFDARGNLTLLEDGYINLYEDIQSHADSVDIHKILERFTNGEQDVLSKVQGFYADFAEMPSTYQEILNAIIAGEETFNSLPVEVKDKFGHSFQRWLIEMETPEFAQKMGFSAPVSAPAPAPASAPVESSGGDSNDS